MNNISDLVAVFDELPPDAEIQLSRWGSGKGWTCKIRSDGKPTAMGMSEKFEVAIAKALIEFYQQQPTT